MNPHQQNKVDINSLGPEEQRLFRLYGKLPNKRDLLSNKLKERKYFDSGDYALSKAGKADTVGVTALGREHPSPDSIPHASSPITNEQHRGSIAGIPDLAPGMLGQHRGSISGVAGSPVKESSFLHREQSIDDQPGEDENGVLNKEAGPSGEGLAIRGPR